MIFIHFIGKNGFFLKIFLGIVLLMSSFLVYADSAAPDYYQIRVWHGTSTSASHLILDWTTVCDTNPTLDSNDYSGGYSCSYNVGNETSPRWCNYEGDYWVQWKFRDEYTGSYTFSATQSTDWVDYITSSPAYYGVKIYNVNWDGDVNDCICKVGSGYWALGGEVSASTCCGDDVNEYKRSCIGDNEICSVSTDDIACCDANTDCVYNNGCYANGQTLSVNGYTYQCDNGYWRGVGAKCGVWFENPKFNAKTPLNDVLIIDRDGDAWFVCTNMHTSTSPPSTLTSTFYIKVAASYKYAFNLNDCYVSGSISQKTSVSSPDGSDFAVKHSDGTWLALFNDAGNIYVRGYAVYNGSVAACPSGYTCSSSDWKCH